MPPKKKKTKSEKRRARKLAARPSFDIHDFLSQSFEYAVIMARKRGFILTGTDKIGFEYLQEDDENIIKMSVAVSSAFMGRLTCLPEEKRKIYQDQYRAQIRNAIEKYGDRLEDWTTHRSELFPNAGNATLSLRIYGDPYRSVILSGLIIVQDNEGNDVAHLLPFPDSKICIINVKEEDAEVNARLELADVFALKYLPEAFQGRHMMDKTLDMACDFVQYASQWECSFSNEYEDFLFALMRPSATDDIDGPFKADCASILGKLTEPSFPDKWPTFLIAAFPTDLQNWTWKLKAFGPIPFDRHCSQDMIELLQKMRSRPEGFFEKDIDIKAILEGEAKEEADVPKYGIFVDFAKEMANEIFSRLGIVKTVEEEEEEEE